MFQQVRKHLNASTFIALLALVFAVTGGAFAATSHSGGGSPAKATASVTPVAATTAKKKAKAPARGPAGPKGETGPAGAAGPTGATGSAGSQGPAGTNGTNGANGEGKEGPQGKEGTPGTSVTSKEFTGEKEKCKEGGSELKAGTKTTYACNGEKGVIHPGETLAPEASETGVWSFGYINENGSGSTQFVPVASFTIPLAARLSEADVHYIDTNNEEATEAGKVPNTGACKAGTVEKPTAEPGNFCVYAKEEAEVETNSGHIYGPEHDEGAGPSGAFEAFSILPGEGDRAWGSWAVTAPAGS